MNFAEFTMVYCTNKTRLIIVPHYPHVVWILISNNNIDFMYRNNNHVDFYGVYKNITFYSRYFYARSNKINRIKDNQ